MPSQANRPAPARAPTMRAESAVVRATPMAAINRSPGIVSAISALRMARSDGRIRPDIDAMANTATASSRCSAAIAVISAAVNA